jgi:CxxC-x17-CxxC domain-containing protein
VSRPTLDVSALGVRAEAQVDHFHGTAPDGGSGDKVLLQDRELSCKECGAAFVFTVGEQEFYLTKGLRHAPQRCAKCRSGGRAVEAPTRRAVAPSAKRKSGGARVKKHGGDAGSEWARRQMTDIRCVHCGKMAQVPFSPRGDNPIYCRACNAALRGVSGSEAL